MSDAALPPQQKRATTPVLIHGQRITLEAGGPDQDPTIWLRGSFEMWGATFVMEAYRVKEVRYDEDGSRQVLDRRRGQGIVYLDWLRSFERLIAAHEPDGGFQTVHIDVGNDGLGGGEHGDYVITIYPSSDS